MRKNGRKFAFSMPPKQAIDQQPMPLSGGGAARSDARAVAKTDSKCRSTMAIYLEDPGAVWVCEVPFCIRNLVITVVLTSFAPSV